MPKIESSFLDISRLDALASQRTLIHGLDPRAKIVTTLIFIFIVVSFPKHEVTALVPFTLYPVVLIALANLPPGYLFQKVLLAAPFAFFVGIFNPLLDSEVLIHLGPVGISGGWVSFASIMLRFGLTVGAALVLVATTGMNGIGAGLEKLGAPNSFAVQLTFLYRYLFVLTDEAARMVRARSLRSFGIKGTEVKVFGYMIGHLLLRTMDRAQRIHQAMLCRGFTGELRLPVPLKFSWRDMGFLAGWSSLFILMRLVNIPQWMGLLVTEVLG
ncbi:cobalt ECF transporter T component CbiQ [Desulforhabdus sp. TSK]|uniref:cobalt ECF transporter T component CbiQ n=1 Tax=Desulforhabdus sp. TSK TaxID=2925014 RepID=UPI001FC8773B|nr:cobalt ECF transporter T component CbiQ [Desulforhabdus sp. TSK]GKT07705.1 cobalt ECF transporter T component CbiQ [Desulforhabdus sp. TSK]